jgi:hypothetical protein
MTSERCEVDDCDPLFDDCLADMNAHFLWVHHIRRRVAFRKMWGLEWQWEFEEWLRHWWYNELLRVLCAESKQNAIAKD